MAEAERLAKAVTELDKLLHEKARLAIATILFHVNKADFNTLRRLLKTSEGNLATHLYTLEEAGYLKVEKKFVGRRPQTLYKLTSKGRKAYQEYLLKLAEILQAGKDIHSKA